MLDCRVLVLKGYSHYVMIKGKNVFGILVLGLMLVGGRAQAATLYVDPSGIYDTGSGTTTAATSIQAAVAAAAPGDTIKVAAGTYAENVVLDKSLTVQGANVGVAGNGVRGAESIVDGSDTDASLAVRASDVVIDGFKVINGSSGGYDAGIWIEDGHQNVSITNSIVSGNAFGVWADCGGNCLIQNNLFESNDKSGTGAGSGSIGADTTDGLKISNNEFRNETAGNPILLQAGGLGAHTNLEVSGNSFHDNTFSAIYVLGITGATFDSNTIVATDATGISFSGGNTSVAITNNSITNSARGIRIEDAGYGLGPNSAFTFSGNTFSGNTEYNIGLLPGGYSGTEFDAPPVITLNGGASVSAFASNGYVEEGASAVDNMGVSLPVVISGTVEDHVPGSYILNYAATDVFGHVGSTTRSVGIVASSGGHGGGNKSSSGSNSNSNDNPSINAGEVLGAFTFDFSNLTPVERQIQVAHVTSELRDRINQLIALLQEELAAALAAGH